MSSTPYKAVSFSKDDVLMKNDMDQINNNIQWINENTPRGILTNQGTSVQKDVSTLILGGATVIRRKPKATSSLVPVRFGGYFAPGSSPYVTTGLVSDKKTDVFCVVNGPGRSLGPTYVGFDISVATNEGGKDYLKRDMWVFWHAFGQGVGG